MRPNRRHGFVMLLALACMTLAAAVVAVTAAGSRSLMLEYERTRSSYAERNIRHSAAAWAQINSGRISALGEDAFVDLDVSDIAQADSSCRIARGRESGSVDITVTVRRGNGRAGVNRTQTHPLHD